jgi:hypothetical protein
MTTVDRRETEDQIETEEQPVEEGRNSVSVEEQPPPRRCRHVTRLIREDGEAYEVTCTCEEGEGTGDGWLDGDGVKWSQKEEHRTRDTPTGDHVYSPAELAQRVTELNANDFVIQGLIPKQSLSLVVGDSGVGKSPLLYQAAICVAAGVPFLEKPVRQGRVLWMDCENGLGQVNALLETISGFLNLPKVPDNLRLWNYNDVSKDFGAATTAFVRMLKQHKPDWVIIDTLKTLFEGIESKNDNAIAMYKFMRQLMAELQCTITGVHHPRKKGNDPRFSVPPLETTNDPWGWFQEASGARSLITNTDVRIGIDKAVTKNADLVVRGFERVNGEFPSLLLARVVDEARDAPIGYRLLTGPDVITNPEHRALWNSLPKVFRFKDAKAVYGKADAAVAHALKRFQTGNLLGKREDGQYEKLTDVRMAS